MILAIVGSRGWTNKDLIREWLLELKPKCVVSGGASGVDSIAAEEAKKLGISVVIYYPEWAKYGKSAGARRNQIIVNECTKLLAFWDGKSKGTKITIDMATKAGKLLKVVQFDSGEGEK